MGGVPALTTRIGFANGVRLYSILLILAYLGFGALFLFDLVPHPYFIPFALFLLIRPTRVLLRMGGKDRHKIVGAMLLHHGAFGILYVLTFIITFGA
jgi:1,4-dihydroxy-2-naphthoate octaprenyltransferase